MRSKEALETVKDYLLQKLKEDNSELGSIIIVESVNVLEELVERDSKLLELYKQAYDKSNAEVLKMFTYEQDEKTTLTNIIGHLDDSETVVQIRELENEIQRNSI